MYQNHQQGNQTQHHKNTQHSLPQHFQGSHQIFTHHMSLLISAQIGEVLQYNAARYHRGDLSGHVGGDGVHQQMVLGIGLLAQLFNHP